MVSPTVDFLRLEEVVILTHGPEEEEEEGQSRLYRISVAVSLLVAFYLDSFLFARFHLFGIRPDCLLALLVSLGVLLGQSDGLILGLVAGLLSDVLFGRAVGLGAVAYMLAGVAGGLFYKKFYADNIVIPAATAAVCAFGKEHLMAVSVRPLRRDV